MDLIGADTDYAILALVYLAVNENQQAVSTKTLAKSQDLPVEFIYKIMGRLTKAGLTKRYMGAKGGFMLAREPEEISLLDIMQATQGRVTMKKCCINPLSCARSRSCAVLPKLAHLQNTLVKSLDDISLLEIVSTKYPVKK
jgi:Rrf2 family transcriptional regulator, iron-sulfur cluster assembly transcription factor